MHGVSWWLQAEGPLRLAPEDLWRGADLLREADGRRHVDQLRRMKLPPGSAPAPPHGGTAVPNRVDHARKRPLGETATRADRGGRASRRARRPARRMARASPHPTAGLAPRRCLRCEQMGDAGYSRTIVRAGRVPPPPAREHCSCERPIPSPSRDSSTKPGPGGAEYAKRVIVPLLPAGLRLISPARSADGSVGSRPGPPNPPRSWPPQTDPGPHRSPPPLLPSSPPASREPAAHSQLRSGRLSSLTPGAIPRSSTPVVRNPVCAEHSPPSAERGRLLAVTIWPPSAGRASATLAIARERPAAAQRGTRAITEAGRSRIDERGPEIRHQRRPARRRLAGHRLRSTRSSAS